MNTTRELNRAADNIRILSAAMVEKANSGHPGGAMGGADFINVLYSEFLEYDPENPFWEGRDRFFLDPGHMSPMLYSVLALTGKYSLDDLKQFRQWESVTPGHPELDVVRGVENTSGPLGQGHTYAVGAAIAAKFLKTRFGDVMNQTIYTYISDGGIQEEVSQGAGRIAGHGTERRVRQHAGPGPARDCHQLGGSLRRQSGRGGRHQAGSPRQVRRRPLGRRLR